jgi:hypothetical protein
MKKLNVLFILIFASITIFAQEWTNYEVIGVENGMAKVNELFASEDNSFFTVGSFNGTISNGSTFHTSATPYETDGYVAKYGEDGGIDWIKTISGEQSNSATDICKTNNYTLAYGTFRDTSYFNNTIEAYSKGSSDIFLAAYSSTGQIMYVKTGGGLWTDQSYKMVADEYGYVYLTGKLTNIMIWDNDTVYSSNSKSSSSFVMQLDETGIFQWLTLLEADKISDIRIVSNLEGDFLLVSGTENGASISRRIDKSGNIHHNYQIGSTYSNYVQAIEHNDYLYILTLYDEWATEFGTEQLPAYGGTDVVLACLNSESELQWVVPMGGSNYDEPGDLLLKNDTLYITLWYQANLAIGDEVIAGQGDYDNLIATFDLQGNFLNYQIIGSSTFDQLPHITFDQNGAMLYAAQTEGSSVHFNDQLYNNGNSGIISGKYTRNVTGLQEFNENALIKTYIHKNWLHVKNETMSQKTISIADLNGRIVSRFETKPASHSKKNLNSFAKGFYILHYANRAYKFTIK